MKKNLYLIKGDTGSYSDYRLWDVIGFLNKRKANSYLKKLNNYLIEKKIHQLSCIKDFSFRNVYKNPLDKNMQVDSNGVLYYIEEVEVHI